MAGVFAHSQLVNLTMPLEKTLAIIAGRISGFGHHSSRDHPLDTDALANQLRSNSVLGNRSWTTYVLPG